MATDDLNFHLVQMHERLRHKEAELAYLTQQRKLVKAEVKSLRKLTENLKQ